MDKKGKHALLFAKKHHASRSPARTGVLLQGGNSAIIARVGLHCIYTPGILSMEAFLLKIPRVGQNHTFVGIYGVHTVFLAGKSPYIRSYTVQIYGSGQPL
jgi:hypothetical protein